MGNEQSGGRIGGGLASRNAAKRAEEMRLLEAFENADHEAVSEILEAHPQLVYAHTKEGGIWHFAAKSGNLKVLEVVSVRVQEAAIHQKREDKVLQQVSKAVQDVNVAVNQLSQLPGIKLPLGHNIDIDAQTGEGVTALMAAVEAGETKATQFLLSCGADAWLQDIGGNCALHLAAAAGDTPTLDALLKHSEKTEARQADALDDSDRLVNKCNAYGLTPLHCACWSGSADAVKLLINHRAHFLVASISDALGRISCNAGSTPLHLAAIKGGMPVVRLLLRAYAKLAELEAQQGLDPSPDPRTLKDKYRKTPQDAAQDMRRKDVAAALDPALSLDAALKATASAGTASSGERRGHAAGAARETSPVERPSKDTPRAMTVPQVTPMPVAAAEAEEPVAEATLAAAPGPAAPPPPPPASAAQQLQQLSLKTEESAIHQGSMCPPDDLICPITNELFKDPVTAADGATYERSAIEVWFELGNSHFPGGHQRITHTRLQDAPAVKTAATAWKVEHSK